MGAIYRCFSPRGRCLTIAGQLLESSARNYLGGRPGFRGAGRGGGGNQPVGAGDSR